MRRNGHWDSAEHQLERIADALEIISGSAVPGPLKRVQSRTQDDLVNPEPVTKSKARPRPDDSKANLLIKDYLDEHPNAKIRDLAACLGLSIGKVAKLRAWREAMAKRKAAKPVRIRPDRPLTEKILEVRGVDNDPAAKALRAEAIWEWLLNEVNPTGKRRALHEE